MGNHIHPKAQKKRALGEYKHIITIRGIKQKPKHFL